MGPDHTKSAVQIPDAHATHAPESTKKPVPSAFAPPHNLTPSHNPPVRILLAEDDPDIRQLTHSILVAQGYTVFSCADGRHALEIFHGGPRFDLLITDIQMPLVSGLELATHLTSIQAEMPVIIISGNTMQEPTLEHITRRGWQFFAKPVPMIPLLDTIEQILAARQPGEVRQPPQPVARQLHPQNKHA